MRSTFSLGRIAGIEVGVNWSWLFIFGLITWTLGEVVFPANNPGLGEGAYWTMAVAAAVVFFASLLAHELGHALEARRQGVEIEGITLWLFGGVAKFKGMYPTAGAEFRIAVAGPLVSAVLGGIFLAVSVGLALPAALDGVLFWLGYINFLLLAFNMLPALPLDGGRVLHSALWGYRDLGWATRVAAGIGRGFGYLMIGGGIALLFVGGGISGLWLAVLGWFLNQAAASEARLLAAREALKGLQVRDLMVREPVTVRPDLTIGQFMDQIAWESRYTTYPVVEDGRTLGLLAFRCVAQVPRGEWDERRLRECMIEQDEVPVVREDEEAAEALAELSQSGVNRALVLQNGRLAGLLSATDVARALEIGPRRR